MLREQLACAKSKGEETVGRNLQMQLERLLARQMEILQDAAVQERLQALDWRIPPAALKYLADQHHSSSNGAATDSSREHQDDRPINLRVVSQSMAEGELPLGKQLANELKRHHNNNHNNNNHNSSSSTNSNSTEEAKAPAAENGTSQRGPGSTEKKTIKSEPEDST